MPTQGTVVVSPVDPWFVNQRVSSLEVRQNFASLLPPSSTPGTMRSGVFLEGDATTTHTGLRVTATSGMTISINRGSAAIDVTSNGTYFGRFPAATTITLDGSSGTQNRIDLIIARVYDDQNSALGSPAGARQFTIEVWKGDWATGTPVQPAPIITAGYIPLAAVYIGKSVGSVTQSVITDLRGSGLPTRGGIRVLYGADAKPSSSAYLDPGSYPGERRWVHGANILNDQVWCGSSMGWRATSGSLTYGTTLTSGGGWVKGASGQQEIGRVTIPDPGVPYRLQPTARVMVTLSPNVGVDLRTTMDSASGAIINWDRVDSMGDTADRLKVRNVPAMTSNVYTGSRVVVVSIAVRDIFQDNPSLWGFRADTTGQSFLSVTVVPDLTGLPSN